jgi:hypothetical protein
VLRIGPLTNRQLQHRYIVFGQQSRPEPPAHRSNNSSRRQDGRKGTKTPALKTSTDDLRLSAKGELWLSIYKHKAYDLPWPDQTMRRLISPQGDSELVAEYPISAIQSCEIQTIAHRRQGTAAPTLVITFDPDSPADKSRKRRSSRTTGLSSRPDPHANSLLFRTIPDEQYNIYDWQIAIQRHIKPHDDYDAPLSPNSPAFTTFVNPFSPRSPIMERAPMSPRPEPYRRGSNATFTSRESVQNYERSQTMTLISPSPSLRSKSSNISSQASSFGRPQGYHRDILPIQQPPADLPSPASMSGFDDQSILGWTAAQGRSSALSNHTRGGSNSVSIVGTPPAPRETILDRAFMMRCIPGSDRLSLEEEGGKISSIARFEALMKEAEERAKSRPGFTESTNRKGSVSDWNLDETEEDEDSDMEEPTQRIGASDVEMENDEVDLAAPSIHEILTPAQRALEYISGRTTPLANPTRRPLSPNDRHMSPLRESPRSRATPPRRATKERPKSLLFSSSSTSTSSHSHKHKNSDDSHHSKSSSSPAVKRRSSNSTKSNSTKRLSITGQRLSSTSSLLLVQTNTSTTSGNAPSGRNSRRTSSEASSDADFDEVVLHRGLSQSRLSGMLAGGGARPAVPENDMKRCDWRGSGLGVFGGEGGFL